MWWVMANKSAVSRIKTETQLQGSLKKCGVCASMLFEVRFYSTEENLCLFLSRAGGTLYVSIYFIQLGNFPDSQQNLSTPQSSSKLSGLLPLAVLVSCLSILSSASLPHLIFYVYPHQRNLPAGSCFPSMKLDIASNYYQNCYMIK